MSTSADALDPSGPYGATSPASLGRKERSAGQKLMRSRPLKTFTGPRTML
jgi:hypothetical protein